MLDRVFAVILTAVSAALQFSKQSTYKKAVLLESIPIVLESSCLS